jgi:hypothetical protein
VPSMGSTSIDVGPVMVRGALSARYARVVWDTGTLYVIHRKAGRVHRQTAATSKPVQPATPNGYWRAKTDDGQTVSFTRRGCGG